MLLPRAPGRLSRKRFGTSTGGSTARLGATESPLPTGPTLPFGSGWTSGRGCGCTRAPSILSAVPTAGTTGTADGCGTMERYIFGHSADITRIVPHSRPVRAAIVRAMSRAPDRARATAQPPRRGRTSSDQRAALECVRVVAQRTPAEHHPMSQSGAASANGAGSGPGIPAAPGYGPGDVLASGQHAPGVPAAPGYGPGDVAASEQPGIFARQGFSHDGRVVPNIFKVVNQDLWTGWGKSSGAEAVLTFPFVLAMSGAVFLPQAVNDIPNIPTLLATALTEMDNGNWGKGLEAAGDGLAAAGMLGELAGGVGALRAGSNAAAEAMDYAMGPGRLGGKLYPRSDLLNLEQDLARRGIELKIGSKFLPKEAAAGFNGVDRFMVFRENPTVLEVEHELAHLEHFEKIGAEVYNNSQLTTRLMKEQFAFDTLSNSQVWESLNDAERQLAKDYIESLGGIY